MTDSTQPDSTPQPRSPKPSRKARKPSTAKAAPEKRMPFHTRADEEPDVYHDHACPAGKRILATNYEEGTGGRQRCSICAKYGYEQYATWMAANLREREADVAKRTKKLNDVLADIQKLEDEIKQLKADKKPLGDRASRLIRLNGTAERFTGEINKKALFLNERRELSKNYTEAYSGVTAKHPLEHVELLADVGMNEARDRSAHAKKCVMYGWLNFNGGVATFPSNPKQISDWSLHESRFRDSPDDYSRASYIASLTDSLHAADARLADSDPAAHDPVHGATNWYSPKALRSMGLQPPDWSKKFKRVKVEGIDDKDFIFMIDPDKDGKQYLYRPDGTARP